jgi:hypothetical protein
MTTGELWISITTIVAVFLGPIFAVLVTRFIDNRREVRTRKMDIFRTLMRTRKMPIHYEHVGALNLVEIEFARDSKVIAAWKAYLEALGEVLPPAQDAAAHEAVSKKREALLTKLIHEIAKVMNFEVEQLDILEGNYLPQGWNDDDWSQKQVRQGLLDVLHGRRPLVIQPFAPAASNPYPPPPTAEELEAKG